VESLAQALEDEFDRQNLPGPSGDTMEAAICCLLDEQAPELLFELIGGLAHRLCRTGMAGDGLGGFSADEARDLIAFGRSPYIPEGDDAQLLRLRTSLVRFAFFGAARKVGSLDFTHEILAEFFAARYAVHKIERALSNLAQQDGRGNGQAGLQSLTDTVTKAVGTCEVAAGSLFHRYFARQADKSPVLREGLQLVQMRGDPDAANARRFLSLLFGTDDQLDGHLLPAAAMARPTSAAWTPAS
jgi:hypothetical protein